MATRSVYPGEYPTTVYVHDGGWTTVRVWSVHEQRWIEGDARLVTPADLAALGEEERTAIVEGQGRNDREED